MLYKSFVYLINFIDWIYYICFKTQENIPTITFVVPFPQVCKYHREYHKEYKDKNYNPWNEFLYKPKSILFCNVDTNEFYRLWNFAAIIDFKWRKFARYYYYLIWLFYIIFSLCFALASTLDQNSISDSNRKILFIFSIILGFIHLFFEFRQFLWKPKIYIKDFWNLFGK